MVMIKDREGNERFFISQQYLDMLHRVRDKINNEDQEFWIAYTAKNAATGVGKSLRAQKDKYIINPNGSINEIVFTKEEFINTVLDAKKGDVIICDEGISIFFSRSSMTKEGRLVAEISNQIRQKNLCIMLCVPEILSTDWIILKKINCVVMIWEDRKQQGNQKVTIKGCSAIYPELPTLPLKSLLVNYLKKKRANPLLPNKPPQPFFQEPGDAITKVPWYPFGEKEYRTKKDAVLHKYRTKLPDVNPTKPMDVKAEMIYDMKTKKDLSYDKISHLLDMPKSTVRDYYKRFKAKVGVRELNVVNNSGEVGNIPKESQAKDNNNGIRTNN